MCLRPLTSIQRSFPEQDGEGGSVAGPGAGGINVRDVELTADHVVFH